MVSDRSELVQSVQRCFAVLEAFEQLPAGGATTSALAEITHLPRPVVRRMLLTLQDLGYVQAHNTRWVVRPQVLRFAHWFTRSSALATVGKKHAQWASNELGQPVAIVQIDGFDLYIISIARHSEETTVRAEVGQRIPVYATVSGWIAMAWNEALPPSVPDRHTAQTITDPELIIRRSKAIRRDKYVIADQEIIEGLTEAGVPILAPHGSIMGSLSIALPSWDYTTHNIRDRAIPILATASRRITHELTQFLL